MVTQSASHESLRAKALAVYERLLIAYGDHPLVPRREPMHELISTILSHRTTERNEAVAYKQMWDHFGSWEATRDAALPELIKTLQPATFPDVKASYIKATLERIYAEQGKPSIDFLRDLSVEAGLAWLMSLPGVGIKTASLVLLFCFSKPVMPVDSHVHRVSQRLGLIRPKVGPTPAHKVLLELLPHDPPVLFNFHIDMLRHGQRVCIWETPRCEDCPLTDLCNWYQAYRKSPDSEH